ncbi:conserved protein of unknown function [Ectopseudomonas oleovorans]|uniref:Uncharacterized protein n=1 Tax=Ectopseudomonas oleovorans TaxID=301 RepID=A0A653B4T5_ECTOL|nr:conserved protein of unknown function [Pseudomonas oleovorans]
MRPARDRGLLPALGRPPPAVRWRLPLLRTRPGGHRRLHAAEDAQGVPATGQRAHRLSVGRHDRHRCQSPAAGRSPQGSAQRVSCPGLCRPRRQRHAPGRQAARRSHRRPGQSGLRPVCPGTAHDLPGWQASALATPGPGHGLAPPERAAVGTAAAAAPAAVGLQLPERQADLALSLRAGEADVAQLLVVELAQHAAGVQTTPEGRPVAPEVAGRARLGRTANGPARSCEVCLAETGHRHAPVAFCHGRSGCRCQKIHDRFKKLLLTPYRFRSIPAELDFLRESVLVKPHSLSFPGNCHDAVHEPGPTAGHTHRAGPLPPR